MSTLLRETLTSSRNSLRQYSGTSRSSQKNLERSLTLCLCPEQNIEKVVTPLGAPSPFECVQVVDDAEPDMRRTDQQAMENT